MGMQARCDNCDWLLFDVQSEAGFGSLPQVIQCRGCPRKYMVRRANGTGIVVNRYGRKRHKIKVIHYG